VIMDQSFSAGVGNWVADEILYQARVHPACPVGKMSDEMKEGIWREMKVVVDTAVGVNVNHAKFPKGKFSLSCIRCVSRTMLVEEVLRLVS
jgi:formamidopyrimidine-DNA glycosylase